MPSHGLSSIALVAPPNTFLLYCRSAFYSGSSEKQQKQRGEDYLDVDDDDYYDELDRFWRPWSDLLYQPAIINFPKELQQTVLLKSHQQVCAMCGKVCWKGKRPNGNNDGTTLSVIPNQNKGICNVCDVQVWDINIVRDEEMGTFEKQKQHSHSNPRNLSRESKVVKFCKGCKRFVHWACFGAKGNQTKCIPCRNRLIEAYHLKSEKKQSEKKKQNRSDIELEKFNQKEQIIRKRQQIKMIEEEKLNFEIDMSSSSCEEKKTKNNNKQSMKQNVRFNIAKENGERIRQKPRTKRVMEPLRFEVEELHSESDGSSSFEKKRKKKRRSSEYNDIIADEPVKSAAKTITTMETVEISRKSIKAAVAIKQKQHSKHVAHSFSSPNYSGKEQKNDDYEDDEDDVSCSSSVAAAEKRKNDFIFLLDN